MSVLNYQQRERAMQECDALLKKETVYANKHEKQIIVPVDGKLKMG